MALESPPTVSPTAQPAYDGFDRLPITGAWRQGRSDKLLSDRDPYTGAELVQIRQASREDMDPALEHAAHAQAGWAAELPSARMDVIRRAAAILDARRDEIVSWLI